MRAYVDIVGAGRNLTKITQPGLGTTTGTVVGASVASLRSLRVESIGGENAVAIYADTDPFWVDLAKVDTPDDIEQFMEQNVHRLPVALHVKVRSGLKLTAFLAGVR